MFALRGRFALVQPIHGCPKGRHGSFGRYFLWHSLSFDGVEYMFDEMRKWWNSEGIEFNIPTMGIQALNSWNISGEPCSGSAVNASYPYNFPAIRCQCYSNNNRTPCHITQLSVGALGIRGVIPEELLIYLF
ncbi:hypothetical protein V6N13_132633 [Hibiscus sabdariffa]|uniref:Uncharacterized protein n=1 Tax=Hibiscus sabdariffa TaxID=183260 RepID=A0ABR2PVX0_9ROSI